MPTRPLTLCRHPGCSRVAEPNGYCNKHQGQVNTVNERYKRDKNIQGMYTHRWQKASKAYLAKHPWCEDCFNKGIYTLATEVHHKVKHRGDTALFWNQDNWMGLCHSCHSIRTRRGE